MNEVVVLEDILDTLPHPTQRISFAARMATGEVRQFVFCHDRAALTLAHALEGLYHAAHPEQAHE